MQGKITIAYILFILLCNFILSIVLILYNLEWFVVLYSNNTYNDIKKKKNNKKIISLTAKFHLKQCWKLDDFISF